MIDLTISGTLGKDIIVFTLNGESKHIDPFTKQVHFSIEEAKNHRLYFEQKSGQYIPHTAEIILNILSFPFRGAFNILTFNTETWEKDISAFKLSGYVDINLTENTEISFKLGQGGFEKQTNTFDKPTISISPDMPIDQTCLVDVKEIIKKHRSHVLNVCSATALLLGILFYLLFAGLKNKMYVACIITSTFITFFSLLTLCLILYSFKKRSCLISALTAQQEKKHD